MSKEIKTKHIENLFDEAARTDSRLPSAIKKQSTTAQWLEMKVEKMYKHSYHEAQILLIPNSRQISRWWVASTILREIVEEKDKKDIIWLKAKRFPWTQISRIVGLDRRKVKRLYEEEIIYIRLWLQLHQKNKKISDMIDKII